MNTTLKEIASSLIAGTDNGRISWERTSNPSEFVSSEVAHTKVAIGCERRTKKMKLLLLDVCGNVIVSKTAYPNSSDYGKINELYEKAQSATAESMAFIDRFVEQLREDSAAIAD